MTDRKKVIKQLDDLFSRYIRARDKYLCYTCGDRGHKSDGVMQCGHLITRGKYATRWDVDNARCQCKGCNYLHEFQPEIFTDKWIMENGEAAYHALVRKSNTIVKFRIDDLRQMVAMYKNLVKEIGG